MTQKTVNIRWTILHNQISSKVALKSFRSLKTTKYLSSKMEKIISNPGLQHLAEKVFLNLDVEDLKICEQISNLQRNRNMLVLLWFLGPLLVL